MVVKIRHIYISPEHNFFGHAGKPPGEAPAIELPSVECFAGMGIQGDRFFGHKTDYKGQITFFEWEVYRSLCSGLGITDKPPSAFRRNVITEGVDLNSLIGKEFEIQGTLFAGTEECRPCYWMNQAFGAGAEALLKGRGGMRARILTDGMLRAEST